MQVSFRQLEREDLALLKDWRNQERIRKVCREYRLLNMENQLSWFKRVSGSRTDDFFIISLGKKRAGICGLTHINWKDRSAEIYYHLGRRTGPNIDVTVGLEAYEFLKKKGFKEYNLNRLWGEAYAFNKGAVRLGLQCGFRREGVLRQSVFWDKRYWDSVIISMLAREYDRGEKRR